MRFLARLLIFTALSTAAFSQVSYERIVNADREPGNWLTYSRTYSGARYSPLKEINVTTMPDVKVKWVYQFPDSTNEVSPLAVDGVLYVTGPNFATALDAHTGRTLWTWKRPLPSGFRSIGFGHVNRGPAILDDRLFVTTLDGFLVALDVASGAQLWATEVADYHLGYSLTAAPLAIEGKVLTGVSGGEAGIRGFIDAYDAVTGKRVWRFWTVPREHDSARQTWAGNSAETGGGPTWVTGSYDPQLKLVYWGVGNPSPDWNGDARSGDNLYTCSVVALGSETGELKWHFQFTPHDTHDWDASHVYVLFDAEINGRNRRLIANANRNGFYYVLDRETGSFITGQPYAKQTWAEGLDAKGRPIPAPKSEPSYQGTLVWPSANGATVWMSPSYSPLSRLIYVPVRNKGAVYYKRDMTYQPGTFYPGGGENELPAEEAGGEIRAMDATSGNAKWTFPLLSPPWAGVLSTAGGLLFAGSDEGNFFALDAETGKPLWDFQTGAHIVANPVSFTVDGHQYVAVSAGHALFAFGL